MLRSLVKVCRNFAGLQTLRPVTSRAATSPISGEVVDPAKNYNTVKDVLDEVNSQIGNDTHGRLFAVLYIHGKQFKVTAEDIICVHAHMPLDLGQSIALDKILLVASTDFTIVGKPVIDKNIAKVYATVIEKSLGAEYRVFRHVQRSRYHRSYFHREPYTLLRINGIEILKQLDA